ncbi:MAG: DUF3990 domain-containing protein [Prevotellaceae bacterium]|jgi:hypothetical protein|nr:DUF3990 domain-containing protein [Prevotellaceae bacterium]
MKVYHGTNVEFGAIDINKCPPDIDFGQAFYTTSIKHHAQLRAEESVRKRGGNINVMEFNFEAAKKIFKKW